MIVVINHKNMIFEKRFISITSIMPKKINIDDETCDAHKIMVTIEWGDENNQTFDFDLDIIYKTKKEAKDNAKYIFCLVKHDFRNKGYVVFDDSDTMLKRVAIK